MQVPGGSGPTRRFTSRRLRYERSSSLPREPSREFHQSGVEPAESGSPRSLERERRWRSVDQHDVQQHGLRRAPTGVSGQLPWGGNPAKTGAADVDTLGYGGLAGDAVYALSFTLPHSANTANVTFTASNLQAISDESWGLDNVRVSICVPTCMTGTVNAVTGTVADVLFINGSAGDPSRTVTVAIGSPLTASLTGSPSGPASARYVLWIWPAPPTRPVSLDLGSSTLGCVVNPTPFQPFLAPQPFRVLVGGMPPVFTAGVGILSSPATAPWTLTRAHGFAQPRTLTLQGVIEDAGSASADGFSVTNAVESVIQ